MILNHFTMHNFSFRFKIVHFLVLNFQSLVDMSMLYAYMKPNELNGKITKVIFFIEPQQNLI